MASAQSGLSGKWASYVWRACSAKARASFNKASASGLRASTGNHNRTVQIHARILASFGSRVPPAHETLAKTCGEAVYYAQHVGRHVLFWLLAGAF